MERILKVAAVLFSLGLLGFVGYLCFEGENSFANFEDFDNKYMVRNEILIYHVNHTQIRNRHYAVPHTKVALYCPECGDLQKAGTMELLPEKDGPENVKKIFDAKNIEALKSNLEGP